MFAYCGNNPVNCYDPTGEFGVLTTLAIAGIAVSAIVGGAVAGISSALSGATVGEILASATIGAVTSGGVATAAALGAAGTLTVGTVALISGVIGVAGEIGSIAIEYAYHKNDANYTFNWGTAVARVVYAGGISAFSGSISYSLNKMYTGANEIVGLCISGEATAALGLVDFGVRQLISVASGSSAASNHSASVAPRSTRQHIAYAY